MMDQIQPIVIGVVIGWLLTQFLTRTVGTRYVRETDFRKFKTDHDSKCSRCQNRRDMALIRQMVVELAIKAGVPAHEVAKIANGGKGLGE